jgi:hypothetical protein
LKDILESIENIDKLCLGAEDRKAYREFYNLCKENDYSSDIEKAISILSRYADYEKQCVDGILIGKEREVFKNEIRSDFRTVLSSFRDDYLFQEKSVQNSCFGITYLFQSIIFNKVHVVENDLRSLFYDSNKFSYLSILKYEHLCGEFSIQEQKDATDSNTGLSQLKEYSLQKTPASNGFKSVSQNTKKEITILLRGIEYTYADAAYSQAYKKLYKLCLEYKEADQFLEVATSIYSRYNDFQDAIIRGLLSLSEIEIKKREINFAYEQLFIRIKRYFGRLGYDFQESNWEREAIRMKEQRGLLYGTLINVEDELLNCINQDNVKILEEIHVVTRKMLLSSSHLMKLFDSLKLYD